MFIGHFAVGLAAKKFTPRTNLAITFIACQLADLIWPILVLLGIETVRVEPHATEVTPLDFISYPFSHGLVALTLWALVLGIAVARLAHDRRAGIVVGFAVISHWLLDFISHRADMPILFGEPRFGLGLWNSRLATVLVEVPLFAMGVYLYTRATQRTSAKSRWLFWSMIALMSMIYIANIFGPTLPVDAPQGAIAGPAMAMWLFVIWAYFADRSATIL